MASTARSFPVALMFVAAVAACDSGPVQGNAPVVAIEVAGGDAQVGAAGYQLGDSIAARVVDSQGDPVSGARVQWSTRDRGGRLAPEFSTTGASGIARSSWLLGRDDGDQVALATFGTLPAARFLATASSGEVVAASGNVAAQCGRYSDGMVQCWASPTDGPARATALDTDTRFLSLAFVAGRWCGGTVAGSIACIDLEAMFPADNFRPEAAPVVQVATGLPLMRKLSGASDSDGGRTWCGIADDSAVWCWGVNRHGQVGSGSIGGVVQLPVPVFGGFKAHDIAVTGGASCALDLLGRAYCWGGVANRVVPGDVDRPVPVAVPTELRFAQIVANSEGTVCGLAPELGAWCWGADSHGGLGRGGDSARSIPRPIVGTDLFVSLGAEATGFLAVTVDRDLVIWGGLGPEIGAMPSRVLSGWLFGQVLPGGGASELCLRAYPLGTRCLDRQRLHPELGADELPPVHGVPAARVAGVGS